MSPEQFGLAFALWAQGAMVFAIIPVLYKRRVPPVLRGDIRAADIALDKSAWPQDAQKAANAYTNQFELPVLFFVAGGGLLWLGVGWFEVALAWGFVLARCVQTVIHVTSNHVFHRFFAFVAGVFLMAVLWLALGARLVMAGLG